MIWARIFPANAARSLSYLRRLSQKHSRVYVLGRAVRLLGAGVPAAAMCLLYSLHTACVADHEVDASLRAVVAELPYVTPDDVARHNTQEDAWVIIDGVAYDVTSLLANHPGGSGVLVAHAGRDVTREFAHLSHSFRAHNMLPGLAVGRLPPSYSTPPLPPLPTMITPPPGSKRIVVVGAGICGTAVASLLSERGHSVTVIDAAPLIGGTALRSTAILFIGPTVEKLGRLRGESLTSWSGHTSFDMMRALSEGPMGRDVGWAERGTLGVIADAAVLEATAKRYAPGGSLHDTGSELVSRERMLELEPALSPALLGATWHPKGATVDPFLVCDAYAARARAAGAQFALGRRVTALARRPGGGFCVVTEKADSLAPSGAPNDPIAIDADELIIAAGWLCRPIASLLGHDVPVGGTHGQLFTTKSDAVGVLRHNLYSWEGAAYWNAHPSAQQATLKTQPPHERMTRHFYAVQAGNGVLKIGGDRIRLPLDATQDHALVQAGIDDTVASAARILPGLAGCEVTGAWGGTMPASPGQSPFLGRLEPGLWVMAGSPFTRGPAYALLVAEALSEGAQPGSHFAAMLEECDPLRPWDAHLRKAGPTQTSSTNAIAATPVVSPAKASSSQRE